MTKKNIQSKKQSLIEAALNIVSGSCIAFTITQLGTLVNLWNISPGKNLLLTLILTFVSIIRSYAWRRMFNNKLKGKHGKS